MVKKIYSALKESFDTIYPIIFIVFFLNLFLKLSFPDLMSFLISSILIIIGMTLFSFGVNISLIPLGKEIGQSVFKSKKMTIILIISFLLGLAVTIVEPDLIILSGQLSNIPNLIFIITVSIGVGIFLMISAYRIFRKYKFNTILIIFYSIILILLFFVPKEFIAISFDAAGATTGSISVPLIISFGLGLISTRNDLKANEDSFGMIGICSIGPIITVLIMGLFYELKSNYIFKINESTNLISLFKGAFLNYGSDILISIIPIIAVLIIYQIITKKYNKKELKKLSLGLFVILIGLTLFLVGANIGFLKIAYLIGNSLMLSEYSYLLLPISAILGFYIVQAEPSVKVLTEQIESITGGSIPKKIIMLCLSVGVSLAVLLSLTRVTTGISILWFIIPGYFISIILSFFIPNVFTSIAFDSGGASSGTMTASFLLPLAIGATTALGGNIISDAFGMVALVSLSPILTIQLLGLIYKIKKQRSISTLTIDETIINYKWGVKNAR